MELFGIKRCGHNMGDYLEYETQKDKVNIQTHRKLSACDHFRDKEAVVYQQNKAPLSVQIVILRKSYYCCRMSREYPLF